MGTAAGADGCGQPPAVGEHCVPVRVQLIYVDHSWSGHCEQLLVMQVPLIAGVDKYGADWWPPKTTTPWEFFASGGPHGHGTGPYGIEVYSTRSLTYALTYKVPNGYGAWLVGYGGGPGACSGNPGRAVAWGWTARWVVSGQVTVHDLTDEPAADVTVRAACPSGGATATDNDGHYMFLLEPGRCTITAEPQAPSEALPTKRNLDVEGDIDHVDFQVTKDLYFKVGTGLSVHAPGSQLIKAGTAFTERVTLEDISTDQSIVVAPIYPGLSGNANGGALQPVGGVVQKQLQSPSSADPSPIVVLKPGESQVFDSVIFTDASSILGTDNGGKAVSGGTRAYVQFQQPRAFILKAGDELAPLDPSLVVTAQGSTDQMAVSIDDSTPDQMPFNGYLASWDISKGLVLGLFHFTVGLVQGVITTLEALGSAVVNIPTAVINYVNAEAELWQEVKDNPVEAALFVNIVTNQMLLVYKQAPFLLKKLGDIKSAVDTAVYEHFNRIEQEWRQGDWQEALTDWADDGTNLSANLLVLNPSLMAGAIGDATIARVPGVLEDLDAAQAAEFAKNDEAVAQALGTGESEGEIGEAVAAEDALAPGNILGPSEMANIYGVSSAEFTSMVATAEKYKLLITLRSRASEAISLIEKGLSYVKPAAIKLKTVSAMDIKYLGYPADVTLDGQEVSSVGQVLIKKPLFLSEDCPAACALAKLQADILSLGVTKDSPVFYEAQSRWVQRYGEWTSNHAGYVGNLEAAAKDHYLTLDWHWQENHIYPDMVQSAQKVGFQLAPGPAGTLMPEVRVGPGPWKTITGDIDLVSITNADGSPLSDEQYVKVLEELGAGPVNIQHPATATWYDDVNDDTSIFDPSDPNFADKAKYMNAEQCCSMQVGPDGKARAVKFQLDGSQFVDQNDYYINYVGGYQAPAPGSPATP